MEKLFNKKTVFITGGGTGIGRACAIAFAAEGAIVTIAGRTEGTLKETVESIKAAGGQARYAICDARDEAAVQKAISLAIGDLGRLDVAVNSAGIDGGNQTYDAANYPNETFDDMIDVNVRGMFYSMKHELAKMVEQGHGSVVNISSGAATEGAKGDIGYAASKSAELGLTRSTALDYASKGIRVNAVCPALVYTPLVAARVDENPKYHDMLRAMHPLGRGAGPNEIADAVVWLNSPKASEVAGIAIPVDGGDTAQ